MKRTMLESAEAEPLMREELETRPSTSGIQACQISIWKAVAVLSTSACISLLILIGVTQPGECNTRFPGEFVSPSFPLKLVQFTGGLKYDETGVLYRDNTTEAVTYVGDSAASDRNWGLLEQAQFFEVDSTPFEGLYTNADGGVITGFDSFHQLHCLNVIRKAVYEPSIDIQHSQKQRLHIDHCIDYIRQAIQCRADMTPLRLYESRFHPQGITVDFEGARMCRDFDAIWGWAMNRRYRGNVSTA